MFYGNPGKFHKTGMYRNKITGYGCLQLENGKIFHGKFNESKLCGAVSLMNTDKGRKELFELSEDGSIIGSKFVIIDDVIHEHHVYNDDGELSVQIWDVEEHCWMDKELEGKENLSISEISCNFIR